MVSFYGVKKTFNEKLTLTLPSGDNVIVQLVAVNHNQIRLGIDAPGNVSILRNELIKDDD